MKSSTTNHSKVRWLPIGAAALVTAIALLALVPLFSKTDQALIQSLTGKASIYDARAKKWKTLSVNAIVPDSSWVETGPSSAMVIFYKDSEVRLGSSTKMRIDSLSGPAKKGKVLVQRGFSWYKMRNRDFEVRTPTAVASVRGTKFAVAHGKSGTATCVCEGAVDVQAKNRKGSKSVQKGFSTASGAGGQMISKDFRKYFRGLKMDRSFQSEIDADAKMAGCKSCHRMTDLATDNSPDPKNY